MVSRIRIGPEGGPFVEIDEDNGTLDLNAPSGDVDLQSNNIINALINGADVSVDAITVNGTQVPLGGSVTLSAVDVGAVDTGDFPDLQFNGVTVDSTDTINFIPE